MALERGRVVADEGEGGRRAACGRVGLTSDRRLRRRGVDCPGVAGDRAGATGRIRGLHVEGMAAVAQAAVALGRHAGGEIRAVEAAPERRPRFAAEGERGCVAVGWVGRRAGDGHGRPGCVQRPTEGGRRVAVAGRVSGRAGGDGNDDRAVAGHAADGHVELLPLVDVGDDGRCRPGRAA